MKNSNIVKSFGDMSPLTAQIADAPSPKTIMESSASPGDATGEDFRELLRLRATAPLSSAIRHHRWGLNE